MRLNEYNMASKVQTAPKSIIKFQVPAGQASPANVGSMLGPHGVSSPQFCQQFNERTKGLESGLPVPVVISIYEDKKFSFVTKSPPTSFLILKALGIEHGSAVPNRDKVGALTEEQLKSIAEMKMGDLNAHSTQMAQRIIAGTARSMGVEVKTK